MEISAKEIARQASRINTQLEQYYNCYNEIMNRLIKIEEIVKSEDSRLAHTVGAFQNQWVALHGKVKSNFAALASRMEKYASETISNEEQSSEQIGGLNTELEEIGSKVESIDIPE